MESTLILEREFGTPFSNVAHIDQWVAAVLEDCKKSHPTDGMIFSGSAYLDSDFAEITGVGDTLGLLEGIRFVQINLHKREDFLETDPAVLDIFRIEVPRGYVLACVPSAMLINVERDAEEEDANDLILLDRELADIVADLLESFARARKLFAPCQQRSFWGSFVDGLTAQR